MNPELMKDKCDDVASMLKAIAHPERLMILCHLSEGEMTVSELLEVCNVSQSQLSQFLIRMSRDGLLSSRREGNFSYYRVADKNMLKLMKAMQKIFCGTDNKG